MIKKGLIIYFIFLFSLFFIGLRLVMFSNQRFDISFAASDLVREQSKMGKKTGMYDDDIITKKILPRSNFQDALNPFIWTMKQRSVNDDLLQACLDADERDKVMDAMKYAKELSTFEERFKEWEVNFEQAKLSLVK